MFKLLILVVLLQVVLSHPERVWPRPRRLFKQSIYYSFQPDSFTIAVKNNNCSLLYKAYNRLLDVCYMLYNTGRRHREINKNKVKKYLAEDYDNSNKGALRKLTIELLEPCEDMPHLNMEEYYELTISRHAVLRSSSIWGILRGLETMAQMFFICKYYFEVYIHESHIEDYPRYKHRGLLLDTSRHYISVDNILTTLEAMAINKMNVFHWHIVDDQSFPYVSSKHPDLSDKGAYYPSMVYTSNDIKEIVDFATERGIRVIPEFDIPGHTRSWGKAYPDFLTQCYIGNEMIFDGPLDPTTDSLYSTLGDLFGELHELFPDKFVHLGGDDVNKACWVFNPRIRSFMKDNNITKVNQLHSYFMNRTVGLLDDRKLIVWQDAFDFDIKLPLDSLIQVWQANWQKEIFDIMAAGYKVIFSSGWHLDDLLNTFESMYGTDPRRGLLKQYGDNIVGGEACMWTQAVDDTNVISRVWPRASAVAEVLWSPAAPVLAGSSRSVRRRVAEHVCHMRQRKIAAAPPLRLGYCLL